MSKQYFWFCIVIIVPTFGQGNTRVSSFSRAKKLVYEIAAPENRTFYCNCAYSEEGIDRNSCGYIPRNDNRRANRTEIEHIVPAENFGRSFSEWREGHPDCVRTNGVPYKGRRCAGKANETYRRMESDLYNLVPAIGELNGDRRNYRYGLIDGAEKRYGACDFSVEDRVAQPRAAIRGDIARVYFYMHETYPGRGILGDKSKKLFDAWASEDPVEQSECTRAARIENIQGNANRFVKEPCLKAGLYDSQR